VLRQAHGCNRTLDEAGDLLDLLCAGESQATPSLAEVRSDSLWINPHISCDAGHYMLAIAVAQQDGLHHFFHDHAALFGCSRHREHRLVMWEQPVTDTMRIESADHYRVRGVYLRFGR